MKKKIIVLSLIILVIISLFLILPFIEIRKGNKLIYIGYNDDISKYETYTCYHESVSYNEKKNISITNFDIKKYLIFYIFTLDYEKGNLCDTEWLLEEEYISNFIENAEILDNPNNINIKELIEGKEAIVGNTRYFTDEDKSFISYKLDGKYNEMYIFYADGMVIIQVGSPDETTKFIAYK